MANLLSTTIDGIITEPKGTSSVSGTTITVDLATGSYFEIDTSSASGDIGTITINNVSSSVVSSFHLLLKQGNSNVRNIKWAALTGPRNFKMPSAGWDTSVSRVLQRDNIFLFTTYDNGTTWIVNQVGEFLGRVTLIYYGSRGVFGG